MTPVTPFPATAFITHPLCLGHQPNDEHPECPERLQAILDTVAAPEFSDLLHLDAPLATHADLALAHDPDHITAVFDAIPTWGLNFLDHDTAVSERSGDAALHAAGAGILAVDVVLSGKATNAFCAVRPPGHHAYRAQSGGFCLFNNIAIAALHAQQRHGIKRVAIIDFDVHHGNGTQDIIWNNPDILFTSIHCWPNYPGTGPASETGAHNNVINIPLPQETTGATIRDVFNQTILPRLAVFRPDMIFISAGYDGHQDDPLGQWQLTEADYSWMMQALLDFSKDYCQNRLVAMLEGGYNISALAACVAATLHTMMNHTG